MNSYYRKFIEKQKLTNSFTIVVKTNNEGVSNNNQFQFTGSLGNFRVIATPLNNNQSPIGPKIGFGNLSNDATITFPNSGLFELEIIPIGNDSTRFRRINFNNGGDRLKLLEIKKWGNVNWTSFTNAFRGCNNLDVTATDVPILTLCTSLTGTFDECTSLIYNNTINLWNINNGLIVDINRMFRGCINFNQPLNQWDTSNIIRPDSLFQNCTIFNQNLSSWITSRMVTFNGMFSNCTNFNNGGSDGIRDWNTTRLGVTTAAIANLSMNSVFFNCTSFNQPLDGWSINNPGMQPIRMSNTFNGCTIFNQNLTSWNMANVTSLNNMFNNCTNFNNGGSDGIRNWNTSNVTNMGLVFANCTNFNQPLDGWDTSNVITTNGMFSSVLTQPNTVFNQNLTSWIMVSNENMENMFQNCTNFNNGGNDGIRNWNTSNVKDMSKMFRQCTNFNQPLDGWTTSNVTTMEEMFRQCTNFNQLLNSFNTSNVISMVGMFFGCISFANDSIKNWDLRSVLPSGMSSFMNGVSNISLGGGNGPTGQGRYDQILIGWSQWVPNLQTLMTLNMGNLTNTVAGNVAKNALINNDWTIIDGLGTNVLA